MEIVLVSYHSPRTSFLLSPLKLPLNCGHNVEVMILSTVSVSVPFSLFHCVCLSTACNPSLCRAKGRGLQPKGLRVKETADFKVYTKGAGTGELKVSIKGPSELHCNFTLPFDLWTSLW